MRASCSLIVLSAELRARAIDPRPHTAAPRRAVFANRQVAVRVRPFNKRETARGAKLAIQMNPATGEVRADGKVPGGDEYHKKYNFDNALWSHDGHGTDKYVSQPKLFKLIGQKLLDDAWNGFNVCLFAYGQSGAGKSFSMTGAKFPDGEGLIPRITQGLLDKIANEPKSEDKEIKLEVSMLEIYIDDLVDLLIDKKKQPEGGIKTYYRPIKPGSKIRITEIIPLTRVPISTVEEMEHYLTIGQGNQTIGETGLNAVSSRAHTIFEIRITKSNIDRKANKKETCFNTVRLVDLAGSERLEKTRESKAFNKQREIEGKAINNSLTHLGSVVRKIAELSGKKLKPRKFQKLMDQISWRTSKLTQLLRDSLGGNCKTVMIAAISPAMTELAETCSTLRYANDIKKISCKAVKAVSKTEKLKKELSAAKKEIEKLKEQLAKAAKGLPIGGNEDDSGEMAELKAQLAELKKSSGGGGAGNLSALQAQVAAKKRTAEMRKTVPHLEFLHPDPNFSRQSCSFLDKPENRAGKKEADVEIKLTGFGCSEEHGIFTNNGGKISVKALDSKNLTIVNGDKLKAGDVRELKPFDRVVMGKRNLFLYRNPGEEKASLSPEDIQKKIDEFDFDTVKEEMFRDELEAQMKAKKEQEAKAKAEYERKVREREAKMKAERDKIEAESRRQKEELEKKMKAMAAMQESEAKAMKERLEKQQKEFLRKQKKMKEEMKKREEDHKLWEIEEKKRQENDAKQAQLVRLSLTRLIPTITEANDILAEFKVAMSFSMLPLSFPDSYGNMVSKVFVQVINRILGKTRKYLWTEETFNEEMFEIRDLYAKYQKDKDKWTMPNPNPFVEGMYKPMYVGQARVWIMGLEYGFPVPDETESKFFKIEGWNSGDTAGGEAPVIGKLYIRLEPHISEEIEEEMLGEPGEDEEDDEDEMPTLANCKSLESLDVTIAIDKIDGIPEYGCSNVFCTFAVPSHISVMEITDKKGEEEEDLDGVFETEIANPNLRKATKQVKIGFNKKFRFRNIGKQFFEWLQKSPLVVKIYGGLPDPNAPIVTQKPKAVKPATVIESSDDEDEDGGDAKQKVVVAGDLTEDQKRQLQEAVAKAKEQERVVKQKEKEIEQLQAKVKELESATPDGLGAKVRDLETQLQAKEKELAEARKNAGKSGACVLV